MTTNKTLTNKEYKDLMAAYAEESLNVTQKYIFDFDIKYLDGSMTKHIFELQSPKVNESGNINTESAYCGEPRLNMVDEAFKSLPENIKKMAYDIHFTHKTVKNLNCPPRSYDNAFKKNRKFHKIEEIRFNYLLSEVSMTNQDLYTYIRNLREEVAELKIGLERLADRVDNASFSI